MILVGWAVATAFLLGVVAGLMISRKMAVKIGINAANDHISRNGRAQPRRMERAELRLLK